MHSPAQFGKVLALAGALVVTREPGALGEKRALLARLALLAELAAAVMEAFALQQDAQSPAAVVVV